MIQVRTPVENYLHYVYLFGPGQRSVYLPHGPYCVKGISQFLAKILVKRGRLNQGNTVSIIDDLGKNVPVGPKNRQAWALLVVTDSKRTRRVLFFLEADFSVPLAILYFLSNAGEQSLAFRDIQKPAPKLFRSSFPDLTPDLFTEITNPFASVRFRFANPSDDRSHLTDLLFIDPPDVNDGILLDFH